MTFVMFGPSNLIEQAMKSPEAARALNTSPSIGNFLAMTLLSFLAIMLLPRQFHVSVVENSTENEVRRARWLFPLYLVAINLFVIPIAIAGLVTFPFGATESDMYVLALPISAGSTLLSVVVFIGGLSAATAMVIVECVALAIMVSNDIVVPLALQRRPDPQGSKANFGGFLLKVAAWRSSPSWRWPTSTTTCWATPSSPPSACCRSRRWRSSRRPSSAACSGAAPPRAAPWAACS